MVMTPWRLKSGPNSQVSNSVVTSVKLTVALAVALAVYVTNPTLNSTGVGSQYGFVITGNGVDDTHKNIPAPRAPAIVCFNKNDGKVEFQGRKIHIRLAEAAATVSTAR